MNGPEFTRYLGIPYRFDNYPGVIGEESREVNCISLIHKILRQEFWVNLPTGMWAREILEDEELIFRTVQEGERTFIGDIFVFGKKDPGESPVFHLAFHTGQTDSRSDPLLLHATDLNGSRSTIWPLRQFPTYPRYERLHAVKRLNPGLFRLTIAPLI